MAEKVATEWVFRDRAGLIAALDGAKRKRRFSLEDLYVSMGARLLNRFLRGEQANLQTDTLFKAAEALDMEWVLRERSDTKAQRRVAHLKAEKEAREKKAMLTEAVEEVIVPTDRDEQGKLIRPLTAEERAQVEAILAEYSRT